MSAGDLKPGDWVHVIARVADLHPNGADLGVELFSKTDQYVAYVRRDRCTVAEKPIPDEPSPGSVALLGKAAFQRIGDRWVAPHEPSGISWAELNRLGDVTVIHHA